MPEGQVEVRSGRLDGRGVFAVLDLSNYGGDGSRNMYRPSHGAGIPKKMAGEGFIHNHDGGRSRLIAFGKLPPLEHADVHKAKVARRHGGTMQQHLLAGRWHISFHHKLILWTGVGHGQWDIVGVGNTLDAGLGLHPLAKPASEGVLFRGGIARIGQIELRDQRIPGVESRLNTAGVLKAAQKQGMPASACERVESLLKSSKLVAAETTAAADKQKTTTHD